MELRHYYEVFRRRAWIIALAVVLAVGGVAYMLGTQPPRYEAEVSILVTPRAIGPTALEDSGFLNFQSDYRETVIKNMIQLLKSRAVLQRVADRVGGSPEGLARRVTIKDLRGTDFLIITAKHEAPEQAALIANTVAQEFSSYYAEINRVEATNARKFIEEQLNLSQNRLSTSERALADFQARSGIVALPDEVARMVQRSLDLQTMYETATVDEKIARTRVAAIQGRLRSQSDARLASISIATNPVVAQIRDHLTGLELELANLRQLYTDQHPKVQALLGRIADDRQRLSTEAAKVVNDQSLGVSPIREQFAREMINAEVEVAVARARALGIIPLMSRMQARLNTVPNNQLTFARLQRDVRVSEALFTKLSSLHQDAMIRESKAGSGGQAYIVVIDLAKAPRVPISAQLPRVATFAALLGLFVGAAMALALESLDDRIRSPRHAEGAYGVPVLAEIPTMNPKTHRYLTTASGVSTVLFPAILIFLIVGAVAGLYLAKAGATPVHVGELGQTMMQALHIIR